MKLVRYGAALAGALAVAALWGPASWAQAKDPNETAYTLTLICAVVASESKNDADIQRTMDAVRKMARVKGYDNRRVSSDLIEMSGALGVERRSKPQAMQENRSVCRRMKLIS